MTAVVPFTPRCPLYPGPRAFLAALGELGATAILTHEDGSVRLDFRVPTSCARKAALIVGEPAAWPAERWEAVTTLAVMLSAGGVAMLGSANDEVRTIGLADLVRSMPRKPGVVLPFPRKRRCRADGRRSQRAGAVGQKGGEHGE